MCGGLLDLTGPLGHWPGARVDLGLVVSPLDEVRPGVFVKADYRQPTGSFKDRGSSVMIGVARDLGVGSVVVDSSGNAGKAAAAHCQAAGLRCQVYVPDGTAPAKVSAMSAFGATVVTVAGGRSAAAEAAQAAVSVTTDAPFYASHVHQPAFHHGVKTIAFELYDQLGPSVAHGTVVAPVGNGTLVLGLWLGFGELAMLGRIPSPPAIVAVQAAGCAPLAGGLPPAAVSLSAAGSPPAAGSLPVAGSPGTVAAGIAIADPPRAAQIRGAVMATRGRFLTVTDEQILAARAELAGWGHDVEPTGAVAWAGAAVLTAAAGTGPPLGARPAASGVRPSAGAGPVVAVLTGR